MKEEIVDFNIREETNVIQASLLRKKTGILPNVFYIRGNKSIYSNIMGYWEKPMFHI